MDSVGATFRVTKDLDIVLCIESLNNSFVNKFWEFINKGKYHNQQKSTGRKLFYRYYDPEDTSFPEMIELFSRKPDVLDIPEGSVLTPIPTDEDVSSLSAILLDDDYYAFIREGKIIIDDIAIIKPEYIIPLKAKAWLDLTKKYRHSDTIDRKTIKKHKNDIFRLYQIIDPGVKVLLSVTILKDMGTFFDLIKQDDTINLEAFGIKGITLTDVIRQLEAIYS